MFKNMIETMDWLWANGYDDVDDYCNANGCEIDDICPDPDEDDFDYDSFFGRSSW